MTLFKQLQKASFRGVPVPVESLSRNFGRRLAIHEFAGSDVPAFDDLGEKARTLQVRCVFSGAHWLAERDRLLRALETPGPGEWMDPTLGALTVRAESWTLLEELNPLGKASFELQFVVQNPQKMKLRELAPSSFSSASRLALVSHEMKGWEPQGEAFLDALLRGESLLSGLEELAVGVQAGMGSATSALGKFETLAFAIRKSKARLRDVLAFPEALVAQWESIAGLIREAMRAPVVEKGSKNSKINIAGVLGSVVSTSLLQRETYARGAFPGHSEAENEARFLRLRKKMAEAEITRAQASFWREALGLADKIREKPLPGASEERMRVQENRLALAAAWEIFVLGELVSLLEGPFTRREDQEELAAAALRVVEGALKRLAPSSSPEETELRFWELSSLRTQILGNSFPDHLEREVVPQGEPLLVLCYRERGDLALLEEVAERNTLSDPLSVMGIIRFYSYEY